MIYVYAVIESSRLPVAAMAGLECQPVEAAAHDGVAAVYSRHATDRVQPTAWRVWEHEAVVEALMRDGAVLPARFGACFATDAQLGQCLATHGDQLAAGLKRVQGCVEIGVRGLNAPATITGPPASTVSPESHSQQRRELAGQVCRTGRDYMSVLIADERCRRERQSDATRLADSIHSRLAPLARDSTRQVLPTPDLFMTAAYLVAVENIASFRSAVLQIGAKIPDLRLLCTGPWPPYHFAPALRADLAYPEAQYV